MLVGPFLSYPFFAVGDTTGGWNRLLSPGSLILFVVGLILFIWGFIKMMNE
tara:strand:+ start:472 stop:624 length:153 start_codon:yes stop_codon:yes gene_type:complete